LDIVNKIITQIEMSSRKTLIGLYFLLILAHVISYNIGFAAISGQPVGRYSN